MTTATDGIATRVYPTPTPIAAGTRRGVGLATRLFVTIALLLIAVIGLTIVISTWTARRLAETKIRHNLASVPGIFQGYEASQTSAHINQVRSLAGEPGTKALMAQAGGNLETAHDSALDFAKTLGAQIVFLFDAQGRLISRSDLPVSAQAGRDFSGVLWVKSPIVNLTETSAYILEVTQTRALFLVASAPVTQGQGNFLKLNGVLAAAFEMTSERARDLARLTDGQVAFLANVAHRSMPMQIEAIAGTPRFETAGFAAHPPLPSAASDALFGQGKPYGPFELEADGEEFIATALPIFSGGGDPIAALLVGRSRTEEMAVFEKINRTILAVGILLLLAAIPVSLIQARRISRPIEQLAGAAAAIRNGNLRVSLPRPKGREVGALTRAFGGMVEELKQKAALESLVASLQHRAGHTTIPAADSHSLLNHEGSQLPQTGETFAGRYRIETLLGFGGMGTVYRVRDLELDEDVALKVLRLPEGSDEEELVKTLKNEIRIARRITHPNVVRAYDMGESGRIRFLTMEYVPGTTLRELLDRKGRVELAPGLQLTKQIFRGLMAVHQEGIIHGDLKPHNVMVTGGGVVKLMDFGVARAAGGQHESADVTIGTPRYMSPEQARGLSLDERSDIYSAGVLMFEIFTGAPPFRDDDINILMRRQITAPAPDPRTLRPDIPEPLARTILACLAKPPEERPQKAADVYRTIMRIEVTTPNAA